MLACERGAFSERWAPCSGKLTRKEASFRCCGLSLVCQGQGKLHIDEQGGMMARKDLEKETERPRYYSQFWLDVAAGRRVIGVGKGAQEAEEAEMSEAESATEAPARAGKAPKGPTIPSVVEA